MLQFVNTGTIKDPFHISGKTPVLSGRAGAKAQLLSGKGGIPIPTEAGSSINRS